MKKLKSQAGMTLGEVLISVLILLMLTAIVAEGIPLAQRAYYKVVDSANAQVLLSDTLTVLRDELSMATDVEISGSTITYKSGKTGVEMTLNNSADGITMTRKGESENTIIVSSGISTKQKLCVQYESPTWTNSDKEAIKLGTVKVTKTGYSGPIASLDNFTIRLMNS